MIITMQEGGANFRTLPIQLGDWFGGESMANEAAVETRGETRSAIDPQSRSDPKIGLDERLFDHAASLKIDMSKLAMHLERRWRDSVRHQIDRLLSCQQWEEDSNEISSGSFGTFLRFLAFAVPDKLAGLGVSPSGNLLAAWHEGQKRVSIEFYDDDRANAVLMRPTERLNEVVAWSGHVGDLMGFIERTGYLDCLG